MFRRGDQIVGNVATEMLATGLVIPTMENAKCMLGVTLIC